MLDVIERITIAWNQISTQTISRSWQKHIPIVVGQELDDNDELGGDVSQRKLTPNNAEMAAGFGV